MLYKCPFQIKCSTDSIAWAKRKWDIEEISDFIQVSGPCESKRNTDFLLPLPMNNFYLILFHSKSLLSSCTHISILLHRISLSTVPAVKRKKEYLNFKSLSISIVQGLSLHEKASYNASGKNIRGRTPWVICIGACLERREKADKCWDSELNLKMEEKASVVPTHRSQREWVQGACVLSLLQRCKEAAQRYWAHEVHWQNSRQTFCLVFLFNLGDWTQPTSISAHFCDLSPTEASEMYHPNVCPFFSYQGISCPILR